MLLKSTILILAFLLFSPFIHARKINVVTEYLEPYQIKNQDGSLGGYSTDIVHALFKITGDTADIQVMPWARAYTLASREKDTLIFSIARTKIREEKFQWIGSLIEEQLYFWALKSEFKQNVSSVEQLKKYIISTTKNSNADQYLRQNNFLKIVPIAKEQQNMGLLFKKRVDLIIGAELTFATRSQLLNFDINKMVKVLSIPELKSDLSIAFSLNTHSELVKRYQQAYKQMVKSGQLEQIQQKWGLESKTTDLPDF